MNEIRRSNERGHADHGWLKSFHTFSFADYYDPAAHGVRAAARDQRGPRARRAPGFGTHGHRDMEIISYVLDGRARAQGLHGHRLDHPPGRRAAHERGQRRACTASSTPRSRTRVHFLQIWIQPDVRGIAPSYEEKRFDVDGEARPAAPHRLAGRAEGSVLIHQDARVYAGLFDGGESATARRAAGRRVYVHVARGAIIANGIDAGGGRRAEAHRRRRRSRSRHGATPKCWCSICRRDTPQRVSRSTKSRMNTAGSTESATCAFGAPSTGLVSPSSATSTRRFVSS